MKPKTVDRVIRDLNELLASIDPSLSLQLINHVMIMVTHRENKRTSGQFDINLAWKEFSRLLRIKLDERLAVISTQPDFDVRREKRIFKISRRTFTDKTNQVLELVENMTTNQAIAFLIEVTVNWCFSIPRNQLHLLPYPLNDKASDKDIADSIHKYYVAYPDLWH